MITVWLTQTIAPFKKRVKTCVDAIKKAQQYTNKKTAYYPHISCGYSQLMERYHQAHSLGADGVLLCPALCGFESMHALAQSSVPLPIMAHPSMTGAFVTTRSHGMSRSFFFGEFLRALGADISIYPHSSGRFQFNDHTCRAIEKRSLCPDSPFKRMYPSPGGGIAPNQICRWNPFQKDIIYLFGRGIIGHPKGVTQGTREIMETLQ